MMSSESEESSDQFDDSNDDGSSEEDMELTESEDVFRKKYAFLKKLAKNIVFENAALADQLVNMDMKVRKMEQEKEFLFQKLLQFQRVGAVKRSVPGLLPFSRGSLVKDPSPSDGGGDVPVRPHPPSLEQPHLQGSRLSPTGTEEVAPTSSRRGSSRMHPPLRQAPPTSKQAPPTHPQSTKRPRNASSHPEAKRSQLVSSDRPRRNLVMDNSEQSSGEWSDSDRELIIDTPSSAAPLPPPSKKEPQSKRRKEAGLGAGPKKPPATKESVEDGEDEELELAMRSGKVRRLHPIALHPDGSPVFPIVVGGLKVLSLGRIVCDRVAYHSERYLLPVDFESQRTYPSMIDPSRKCSYTCRILDGGEAPIFEMVADDDRDNPIRASSSTACQTIVLKNINRARDKQATNSGSGPEFFGYSNPTILNLLQKMPDAKKCPKYKFVRFAEPSRRGGGGQRSAAAGGGGGVGQGRARKMNTKSKALVKGRKAVPAKNIPAKKKLDLDMVESKGPGAPMGGRQLQLSRMESSPAIAPILGSTLEAQYGMGALSDTSSEDSSTATDNELVIDS